MKKLLEILLYLTLFLLITGVIPVIFVILAFKYKIIVVAAIVFSIVGTVHEIAQM